MPVITVELWEGRTVAQRKEIVEEMTAVFTKRGMPPQAVIVILKDNPKHNYAVGGKLSSEP
ncbi:MAG: tautomerase family protein [Chloroflexi bacterium]|nr:tautomerase family protein [Chloroflexota bacterium]MBI2980022.1 tautomerase family protein [Chloroflexota bacterium]